MSPNCTKFITIYLLLLYDNYHCCLTCFIIVISFVNFVNEFCVSWQQRIILGVFNMKKGDQNQTESDLFVSILSFSPIGLAPFKTNRAAAIKCLKKWRLINYKQRWIKYKKAACWKNKIDAVILLSHLPKGSLKFHMHWGRDIKENRST